MQNTGKLYTFNVYNTIYVSLIEKMLTISVNSLNFMLNNTMRKLSEEVLVDKWDLRYMSNVSICCCKKKCILNS